MLRINLLPSYVAQRRLTRQIAVASIALCAGIILVMVGIYTPLPGQISDLKQKAAIAEGYKVQVDNLNTEISNVTAQQPQYDNKTKFVTNVEAYNAYYAKLYRSVASYTVPGILYSSVSCSGASMSISAYTPRLAVMSDYWAHMLNNPNLASVSLSAFPGYKADYTPSKKSETIPTLPPGYTATFKGSTEPVKSFTVEGGNITEISSGETTGMGDQQQNNGGMGETNQKILFNAATNGFDFTVTATLKATAVQTPPTPPTVGGGPSSSGPGGPGGGPGGPAGMGGPGGPAGMGGPPGGRPGGA